MDDVQESKNENKMNGGPKRSTLFIRYNLFSSIHYVPQALRLVRKYRRYQNTEANAVLIL